MVFGARIFFSNSLYFCRDVPVFKKKILENRITSVQDLFILKNAVTLNRQKIVPSMYVFLKINVEQKMYLRIYEIYSNNLIYKE